MPRPAIKDKMSSAGKWPAKMVSNKWGEPMALFAVPLPSACNSSFLCLCKRLFWNVGTSYFSAFCPLTAEESTLLPHSSAVVQLVSVTPALVTGENRKMPQDLLAYTLWGDIVGIPYVSISQSRQQRGRTTKEIPFDDLLSSAWVPAVNAPFVGATTGNRTVGGGSMKDIFIISNDEQTRQSLLKGKNIVFPRHDDQTRPVTVDKDPIPVPVQTQQVIASDKTAQPEKAPSKNRQETSKTTTKGCDETSKIPTNDRDQTLEGTTTTKDHPTTPKKVTATGKCDQKTKVPLKLKDQNKLTETSEASSTSKNVDLVTKTSPIAKDRDHSSKMAPTSSSLYKIYKRCPENEASPTNGTGDIKPPSTQAASQSTDKHQEMVLPRIESVFSLADASTHVGSLSKELFDSLAQKSSFQKQSPPKSLSTSKEVPGKKVNSVPVRSTNGETLGVTTQKAGDVIQRKNLQNMKCERPTMSTDSRPAIVPLLAPKPDPVRQSMKSPSTGRVEDTVAETKCASSERLTAKTTNMPTNRCRKKNGCTVKELLQNCGHMSSIHPTTAPPYQVKEPIAVTTSTGPGEDAENSKCTANNTSLSADGSREEASRILSKEFQLNKRSPLKMVIKSKPGGAEVMGNRRRPPNEVLGVLGGKVPRLRLHKLDISQYRFVNSDEILDTCSAPPEYEKSECMEGPGPVCGDDTLINSDQIAVSESIERNTPTLIKSGKRKRKKRKSIFCRPKKGYSAKLHRLLNDAKRDSGMDDRRDHLSDCQNKMFERRKKRRIGDFSSFWEPVDFAKETTLDPHDSKKDTQLGLLRKDDNTLGLAGVRNAPNPINSNVDSQSFTGPSEPSLDDSILSRHETLEEPSSSPSPSSDSEWEFPDGKSVEVDINSDWDSSLEDEEVASPQKPIPPIKNIPFGDFRHMVLQDRLRLLEETIKEHKAVLNGIHGRPLDA